MRAPPGSATSTLPTRALPPDKRVDWAARALGFPTLSSWQPAVPEGVNERTAMSSDDERVKPDGSAWRNAQKEVQERNDEARKRGREERKEYERGQAAQRQAADKRGDVHR